MTNADRPEKTYKLSEMYKGLEGVLSQVKPNEVDIVLNLVNYVTQGRLELTASRKKIEKDGLPVRIIASYDEKQRFGKHKQGVVYELSNGVLEWDYIHLVQERIGHAIARLQLDWGVSTPEFSPLSDEEIETLQNMRQKSLSRHQEILRELENLADRFKNKLLSQ